MANEHDRIKVNNTKAHLESLTGELRVVNENLTEALKQKTSAEESLKSIQEQITKAGEELQATYAKRDELETGFVSRESNLSLKERELADERVKFEEHKTSQLASIDEKRIVAEADIREKEETLTTLTNKLAELSPQVSASQDELDDLTKKVAKKKKELNDLTNKISEATRSGEEATSKKQKELDSIKKQIREADETLEERGRQVAVRKDTLKAREDAIDKRERDFEIMYARLERVFSQLYPGQTLNI